MGVEQSIEVARPFADISKWPKNKVESVVQHYMSGEFDFGIDCGAVMAITGYEIDDAKELLTAHSKNESGIINAITLLVTIIALGNSENRNEMGRLEGIFDLMDFNASSFTFILEGRVADDKAQGYEQNAMTLAKQLLGGMSKKPYGNSLVKKEDFCEAVKERFFANGFVLINEIFQQAIQVPPVEGEQQSGDLIR